MAGGNLSPRQKMINLMYIVLTAFLAMNVSAKTLNAFALVEQGLMVTSTSIEKKNQIAFSKYQELAAINPDKVKEWKKSAEKLQNKTQVILDTLASIRRQLIIVLDGKEKALASGALREDGTIDIMHLGEKGGTDKGTFYFLGDESIATDGKAPELKKLIEEYKEMLLSIILPKDKEAFKSVITSVDSLLSTEDPPKDKDGKQLTWEDQRFYKVPAIALFPILANIEVNIRNCQSDLIGYLVGRIDAGSFKFNKLDAMVFPKSSAVLEGEEYEAEIFLAASDTLQKPTVFLGSTKLPLNKNGRGVYKTRASRVGEQTFSGMIEFKNSDGSIIKRPYKQSYTVLARSVVISPTKMNVLYRGLENPISVAANGIKGDMLTVKAVGGITLTKKSGNDYIAKPGAGKEATIEVWDKTSGTSKKVGEMKFRIKDVPPPTPRLDGSSEKSISKSELNGSQGVFADMPRDFDFEVKFKVKSFSVSVVADGYEVEKTSSSYLLTADQKKLLEKVRPKQKIYFTNIKAEGPSGSIDLPDLTIKVK